MQPRADNFGHFPVVLVNPPLAPLRPSLGLGLLKAANERAGIPTHVIEAQMRFARQFGVRRYQHLASNATGSALLVEWLFARIAFGYSPGSPLTEGEWLRGPDVGAHVEILGLSPSVRTLEEALRDMEERHRDFFQAFLDGLVDQVVASGAKVLGASSTFEQTTAALALFRTAKARGEITTVLGGYNCEGYAGRVLARQCADLDIAFSGEADVLFPRMCQEILEHGRVEGIRAAGRVAWTRANSVGPRPAQPLRASVENLDGLPLPDYGPALADYREAGLGEALGPPAVPFETSRGCWWGQKLQCKFCGLSDAALRYRQKTPDRAVVEVAELSRLHGVEDFIATDLIMPTDFVGPFLERLEGLPGRPTFFYETKSNLGFEKMRRLARAGVNRLQPGIEALDDGILREINKGARALQNIALLKHAARLKVWAYWNVLLGFPGVSKEQDLAQLEVFPALYHLQPPMYVNPVRFDRDSVYHRRPGDHGLRLEPAWGYRLVYPFPDEDLEDFAYYFTDREHERTYSDPAFLRPFQEKHREWSRSYLRGAALTYALEEGQLVVTDSRGDARPKTSQWDPRVGALLDLANDPTSVGEFALGAQRLGFSQEGAEALLQDLAREALVLRRDGQVLSLAIPRAPVEA